MDYILRGGRWVRGNPKTANDVRVRADLVKHGRPICESTLSDRIWSSHCTGIADAPFHYSGNSCLPCQEAIRAAINAERSTLPTSAPRPPQLWEPCERCGREPSYLVASGHLCQRCRDAGEDHPRIRGPATPTYSVEPDGAA